MRRVAAAACLFLLLAAPVLAQVPTEPGIATAPASPDFLTRYDFHLSAAALSTSDPRFSWETHFGGDFDVVDYVLGRATVYVDYEAQCGSEFRPFDPYQGNYVLEGALSVRPSGSEVQAIFHHESRHLGDRSKNFAVAWNVLGARFLERFELGAAQVDVRASGGKIIQHSYVDYDWTADLDVLARHAMNDRFGVFGRGYAELYTVDGSRPSRGTQFGGRLEAGVRVSGRAGALEIFGGVERRIDADQIELEVEQWALVGLRLVR